MFNIVPEGTALHIVERFHILPSLLLVPWVALGLDRLCGALARVPALGNLGRPAMLGVWVACAGGVAAALSLEGVREGHSPAVERYVLNTLRSLPPNTVLIGSGDHRSFGFLYAQEVLKERPDVLYADSIMMNYPWYRAKIERRFGAPLLPPGPEPGTVRMARTVLKAKRPLYLAAVTNGNLVGALPNYPLGTCIRVLPEGEPMPDPVTVAQQNDALFRRFDLDYVIPQRSDEGWAVEVHKDYARPWEGLAAVFERAGDRASAKAAWDRARSVAPWLPEKY
jgi:predicted outer membrane lipoprotein